MKQFIIIFVIILTALTPVYAEDETYFQYPQVPENLVTLSDRANYFIEHFWERCNLQSAFSSRAKMKQAFVDYVSFMPYASRDTVETSIKKLINIVKKEPKNLLTLGQIAEETLYSDSAEFMIDEIYLYFADAVAKSSKISSADKARFAHQVKVLSQSQIGMTAYPLTFTTPSGTKENLNSVSADNIILFFNDPDCEDCQSVKVKLATDFYTIRMIDSGSLKIVSIYPGEADEQWMKEASEYPDSWIVGAAPDADLYFDMRFTPSLYLLDNNHQIVDKNLIIDNLLNAIKSVVTNN